MYKLNYNAFLLPYKVFKLFSLTVQIKIVFLQATLKSNLSHGSEYMIL